MKLAEVVDRLYLHDSVVQNVIYVPDDGTLVLTIELCNWAQPGYVDGEPEVVTRSLAFSGVTSYRVTPDDGTVRGGQILVARVFSSGNRGMSEALELVLANRPEEDVTIMTISAKDVVLA